jgi:hypothetical protein
LFVSLFLRSFKRDVRLKEKKQMPFVAGKRACPSALSRPRGWRLSKRSAEP